MTNNEPEFCKACGVEVLFGEARICGTCGNGGEIGSRDESRPLLFVPTRSGFTFIESDEKCDRCQAWCGDYDLSFWAFYSEFEDFADDVDFTWCSECVLEGFKKDNPDFEATGLKFENYLVWKEALASGLDLMSKLVDDETSNAVRNLHDCGVGREEIVDWLRFDCPIDEAEYWVEWNCPPEKIAAYLAQGLTDCPDKHYRELGVNLEDAVFYELNGFSYDYDEGYPCYIGDWLSSGLKKTQLLELRNALSEKEAEFESLHGRTQEFGKDEDFYDYFSASLPFMFRTLRKVGLKVDVENLRRYWGLDASQILKVIDIGGEVERAANMVRLGVPVAKVPLFEKLAAVGVAENVSLLLVKRGLLHKHLKQMEKQENIKLSIETLYELLTSIQPMKVDDAIRWFVSGLDVAQIKQWALYEIDSEVAVKWAKEGFSPITTKQWIAAGVNSPVTARRRRDAGVNP